MTLIPLQGHVSEETAYLQDDYPYGNYRCQRRIWVETATKGSKKGQMRAVFQTCNPKTGRWNSPHPDQYYDFVLLMHNTDNDHIEPEILTIYTADSTIAHFNNFHAAYYQQLNKENQKVVDHVGTSIATRKNTSRVFLSEAQPHQGDRLEVEIGYRYEKDVGLVRDLAVSWVGKGNLAAIPVVSAQKYHPQKGFLYDLLYEIPEDVEREAREIAGQKIARSRESLFVDHPEPSVAELREAVADGLNTISKLTEHFYGQEDYDDTKVPSPLAIVSHRVRIDLLGGYPAYVIDDEGIIVLEEEHLARGKPTAIAESPAIEEVGDLSGFDDEMDEFDGDGDHGAAEVDPDLAAAWKSSTDDEPEEDEDSDGDLDKLDEVARYYEIVAYAAPSPEKLTAKKAIEVLEFNHNNDALEGFKSWLLEQKLKPEAKKAIEGWSAPSDQPFEVVVEQDVSNVSNEPAPKKGKKAKAAKVEKVEAIAPASKLKAEPKPEVPVTASEPVHWKMKQAIAPEDQDAILETLLGLAEEELIRRVFEPVGEVKPASGKKGKKGDRPPLPAPKGKGKLLAPAEQAEINKQTYAEMGAFIASVDAVGPTKAGAAIGIGETTASQRKRTWNAYLHGSPRIKEWFDSGYISWSQIYAERGDVAAVETALIAKMQKRGVLPPGVEPPF